MCTPYPEFVLTGVICIEKALKGTEIRSVRINRNFVLSVFVLTRFYCTNVLSTPYCVDDVISNKQRMGRYSNSSARGRVRGRGRGSVRIGQKEYKTLTIKKVFILYICQYIINLIYIYTYTNRANWRVWTFP